MKKFLVFAVVCVALLNCCHKVKKEAPVTVSPAAVTVVKDTTKAVKAVEVKKADTSKVKEPVKK